jgi:hypothetical protein
MNENIKKEKISEIKIQETIKNIITSLDNTLDNMPLGEMSKFIAKLTIEINEMESKLATFSLEELILVAKKAGIKFFTKNLTKEDIISVVMSDARKEDLKRILKEQ